MEDLFKQNNRFQVICAWCPHWHKIMIIIRLKIKYMFCLNRQMCWFYIAQPLSDKHATMIYCDFLGDVLLVEHRGILPFMDFKRCARIRIDLFGKITDFSLFIYWSFVSLIVIYSQINFRYPYSLHLVSKTRTQQRLWNRV